MHNWAGHLQESMRRRHQKHFPFNTWYHGRLGGGGGSPTHSSQSWCTVHPRPSPLTHCPRELPTRPSAPWSTCLWKGPCSTDCLREHARRPSAPRKHMPALPSSSAACPADPLCEARTYGDLQEAHRQRQRERPQVHWRARAVRRGHHPPEVHRGHGQQRGVPQQQGRHHHGLPQRVPPTLKAPMPPCDANGIRRMPWGLSHASDM